MLNKTVLSEGFLYYFVYLRRINAPLSSFSGFKVRDVPGFKVGEAGRGSEWCIGWHLHDKESIYCDKRYSDEQNSQTLIVGFLLESVNSLGGVACSGGKR